MLENKKMEILQLILQSQKKTKFEENQVVISTRNDPIFLE